MEATSPRSVGMESNDREASRLLQAVCRGDAPAAERLAPIVYDELRGLARHYLRESSGHTLQPTALVHEAYLKLADGEASDPRSATHFRAIAAVAMRQVLIDHARGRSREKRGGAARQVTLVTAIGQETEPEPGYDSEALEVALAKLAGLDPRAARVVEMRFFAGMTEEEIAAILGVTDRTVRNDWRMARAWLRAELATDE